MIKGILRLLPQSLVERVFALYSVGVLTFILAGLGTFYYYQFTDAIESAQESSAQLTEIIAPTITDSVIIGDYDTVQRTLQKVLFRSIYASADFIDLRGGMVHAESSSLGQVDAPAWLYLLVERRLFDVNRNISAGGRDYGVLRLKFSPAYIAREIWSVTKASLLIAALCFLFGIGLIRIPLRHWLGNLDRIRAFEWESETGAVDPKGLLGRDAPLEIRQTFEVLNRTATSLQLQRARADVTLGAIADGVITFDSQGKVVYANPVAIRLFELDAGSVLGRDMRTLLPEEIVQVFDDLRRGGARSGRLELKTEADAQRVIEYGWTPISEVAERAAGYVFACRDVTEAHLLELKLRAELEMRSKALDSLREVMRGLQGGDDTILASSDDIQAMSKFIADLSRERARVTSLLEVSARELGYQKSALDAHAIVTITDARGAITYANAKFTEISGYSAAELIGQNHRIMRSGVHDSRFYADMWDTITSGKTWHGQIANRSKDGEIYWAESTIVPWLDDHGTPYQYIAIRTDITAVKKVEAALRESEEMLRTSIETIGEAFVIYDPDDRLVFCNEKYRDIYGASAPVIEPGRTFEEILRYGVARGQYKDAAGREEAWIAERLASHRRGASELEQKLDDGRWLKIRERHTAAGHTVGFRVDITDLKEAKEAVEAQRDHLEHLVAEGKLLAEAVQEARARELEIGTSIQRSLLKDEVPDGIQGAWLASFTEPSQGIDGDFYAIRHFHAGCFEVLVGDVMGKGVPAALIGAAIKTTYNQVLTDLLVESAGTLPPPAEIVNRLHKTLTPRLIALSSFATLALYRFDGNTGSMTYVNAGHTPGLLSRGPDAKAEPIMGDNLPIGVMPEETYVEFSVPVAPGDTLLLYSDGITEARNEEGVEFGVERLTNLVAAGRRAALPPATVLHCIRQELRRFVGREYLEDDQTALLIDLHAQRSPPRGRIEQRVNPLLFNLPWDLNALAALRARVAESAWFLPTQDAQALVLATFEAASNIIRHAPPLVADATLACRVTRRDRELVVELIYPSEAFSPPDELRPDFSGESDGGFGLFIIQESVDSVEYGSLLPGIGSIRLVKRAGTAQEADR